ncbi:hypothetical protein [Rhodoblastus sp.]|uniref:hypothetical protein n=1 Tax=Rhodoblastus sp. TaxID=1962975 RepID=UPI003F99D1B0
MLSPPAGAVMAAALAVVSATVSPSAAAVPVSVTPCSSAADTWGTIVGLLLQNQLTTSLGVHGVAQPDGGAGLVCP